MQPAHPAVSDIQTALAEKGVTPPSGLEGIRAAVIAEWDRLTGYKPFLGASVAVTVYFDPPYKIRDFTLDLEGGFWAVTSVKTGVTADSAGTELTLGTHYDLLPLDAATEERGWNRARFRGHPGFAPGSIEFIGKRGYAEQLPDDVWQAELDEMCRRAEERAASSSSNVEEIKQGPVTIKMGKSGGHWSNANKNLRSLARAYMRI